MNTQGLMVKDLKQFLQTIIKPILNTPGSLKKSKKWRNIKLSSRELLGLFLICLAGRELTGQDWTISSDPETDDGVVVCRTPPREGEAFATEQVYVPSFKEGNINSLIVDAINSKSSHGENYGKDRHLIVYCDKTGSLDLQHIKKTVSSNDIFPSYWIIARTSMVGWVFLVASIKSQNDPTVVFEVVIGEDFNGWKIRSVGKV